MLTLRSEYITTHQMSPFLTRRRNIFGHFRQPWEMFGKSSKIFKNRGDVFEIPVI